MLASAKELFKKADLTQEQAQMVVEAQATRDRAVIQKAVDQYNATRTEWRTQIGREYSDAQLNTMRSEVGQALSTIPEATRKEFFDAMATTGAGDNPAFIRVFHALSKQVIEGKAVTGGVPDGPKERSGFAKSLFPNLP